MQPSDKCYNIDQMIDLTKPGNEQLATKPLAELLGMVAKDNPLLDYPIKNLDNLDKRNILVKEFQRPAGYSATTRLSCGRL